MARRGHHGAAVGTAPSQVRLIPTASGSGSRSDELGDSAVVRSGQGTGGR